MPGNWHHIPVLRLLLPLVAGILTGMFVHVPVKWFMLPCMAIAILYACAIRKRTWISNYRIQWMYGTILQLMLVCCGYILLHHKTPDRQIDYFLHQADSTAVFVCRVTKEPLQGARSIRVDMEIIARYQQNGLAVVKGDAILWLRNDSLASVPIRYGDEFLIRNIFVPPDPPSNPGAFDYRKYLQTTGIFHIAFAAPDEIIHTGRSTPKKAWQTIFDARQYFHRVMLAHVHHPDAQTVGEALVIGTRTDISDEVKQAYANTGTMHILAVSGLHVGILFAVLEFLWRPVRWFRDNKYGRYVKCVLLLVIIWWYACLSGLSPSVNRSAVMFSFMAVGKLFERQTNTFNILFVSMFVLLIDDPWCITQVGFQLSYLAVAGIVFFQPYFDKIWRPKFGPLKYVWSMITVSMAAQIATMPVTLFYFHQFPNYFLLSNIIAIPVSFVVLMLGLLFFMVGSIPFIAPLVGTLLDWSLQLLNASVLWVEGLPYAVQDNVYINRFEVMCMFFILLFSGFVLATRHVVWLRWIWVGMLLCVFSISMRVYGNLRANRLSIYRVRNADVMVLQTGSKTVMLSDTLPFAGTVPYLHHVRNDLLAHGAIPDRELDLRDTTLQTGETHAQQGPYVVAGEYVVFLLTPTFVHQMPVQAPEVDVLYIRGNPYLNLPDLRSRFPNATLIIGSTNSWKRNHYYARAGREAGFTVWSVPDQGAFILNF